MLARRNARQGADTKGQHAAELQCECYSKDTHHDVCCVSLPTCSLCLKFLAVNDESSAGAAGFRCRPAAFPASGVFDGHPTITPDGLSLPLSFNLYSVSVLAAKYSFQERCTEQRFWS